MEWQTIGTLVSVATGVVALILNWRTRRDLRMSKLPVVKIEQTDWEKNPTALELHLRSRSNIGYRVESVTVVRPRRARIALADTRERKLQRTVKPELFVAHEGQRGRDIIMGSGDHHSVPLVFSFAKSSSRLITTLKSWSARSVSSQSLKASFIVRLTDENATTSVHRTEIMLMAPKAIATKGP